MSILCIHLTVTNYTKASANVLHQKCYHAMHDKWNSNYFQQKKNTVNLNIRSHMSNVTFFLYLLYFPFLLSSKQNYCTFESHKFLALAAAFKKKKKCLPQYNESTLCVMKQTLAVIAKSLQTHITYIYIKFNEIQFFFFYENQACGSKFMFQAIKTLHNFYQ